MIEKIISEDDFIQLFFIMDEMNNSIVSFYFNDNCLSVKITEECDSYFSTSLNKKDMTLLIEKLTKMRDKMIEEEIK
jgi:hypothetical protein